MWHKEVTRRVDCVSATCSPQGLSGAVANCQFLNFYWSCDCAGRGGEGGIIAQRAHTTGSRRRRLDIRDDWLTGTKSGRRRQNEDVSLMDVAAWIECLPFRMMAAVAIQRWELKLAVSSLLLWRLLIVCMRSIEHRCEVEDFCRTC